MVLIVADKKPKPSKVDSRETTIKVSKPTRDKLKELAAIRGETMPVVADELLNRILTDELVAAAVAKLKKHGKAPE